MDKIKLIAIDIGGTLLKDDNTISKENLEAIEKAKSLDIKIALATAREYSSTKYISSVINCDYGVFSNGSHVFDVKNKKTIINNIIKQEAVIDIIKYCKANQLYIHLNQELCEVSDELAFFTLKHHLLNKSYSAELKSNCFVVPDLYKHVLECDNITKIVIVSDRSLTGAIEELKPILNAHQLFITEIYQDSYDQVLDKSISYIEIGSTNDNKATGINKLLEVVKIEKAEVLVIGDGDNDIKMFQEFEHSACMNSGSDAAKKKASYIALDNHDNGVANAIYHFLDK